MLDQICLSLFPDIFIWCKSLHLCVGRFGQKPSDAANASLLQNFSSLLAPLGVNAHARTLRQCLLWSHIVLNTRGSKGSADLNSDSNTSCFCFNQIPEVCPLKEALGR